MSLDPETSRLIGQLQGEQKATTRAIAAMTEANTREHAEVIAEIRSLEGKLDSKADNARVDAYGQRLRAVENSVSEAKGGARLIQYLQGVAVVVLMLLAYLAAKGG